MEIAVNTRLLIKDKIDGIGRFSYETLKRITQQHPEDHFYFFFDRNFDEEFLFSENITPIVIGPQARHPILFYIWFEHSVAPILNKLNVDVFLSPEGFLPIKAKTKQLAVLHDLNYFHYPDDLPWLVKKYYHYFIPKFAAKATRIATVSNFSKIDIEQKLNVASSKIDVVFNGASEIFQPIKDSKIKQEVKNKYCGGNDFFLFVGSLHPRKNISNLLKAFDEFKTKHENNIKLVIAGAKYFWTSEMDNIHRNLNHKGDIIFTGRLDDSEVSKLMASSLALTYVPYFEGFGLPIIEAMQSEVPVITSNVTSMPEVASNAALLVDPFDVSEIANALNKVASDDELRKSLIEKGKSRAQEFNWQKTSNLLYDSIIKTYNS